MERITQIEYPIDRLQHILSGVTFFKRLLEHDTTQFEALMSITQFVTAEADESIIRKGEPANILYFLLRGQLSVYNSETTTDKLLNQINAGEVFGAMAMILDTPRTASLKTEQKPALLAGIDFQFFEDLEDFSIFTMETKLEFYRMVVNNLRWTLERNRIADNNHPLVIKLHKLPLYTGIKGGIEELEALQEQALQAARLLAQWNEYSDRKELIEDV